MRSVNTRSERKPGSTDSTRCIASSNNPVQTNKVTVPQTCATTNAARARHVRLSVEDLERNAFTSNWPYERRAGPTPNAMLVISVSAVANARTRRSAPGRSATGNASGTRRASRGVPATASTTPIMPPIPARTTLSVSSRRTSRSRPAPSATRTAVSCLRIITRTNSSVARFPQAVSITHKAAPNTASTSVRDCGEVKAARISTTVAPRCLAASSRRSSRPPCATSRSPRSSCAAGSATW